MHARARAGWRVLSHGAKLGLNLQQFSCFTFPSAGIPGMSHRSALKEETEKTVVANGTRRGSAGEQVYKVPEPGLTSTSVAVPFESMWSEDSKDGPFSPQAPGLAEVQLGCS